MLAEQVQIADETACFEALCVQYVAMTRARYALFMITSFPGKTSTAITPAALLKSQLTGEPRPKDGPHITIDGEEMICLYEAGERDWYIKIPKSERALEPAKLPQLAKDFIRQSSQRKRLVQISPSAQVEHERNAATLFERAYQESLDFGSALHELFAKVSWIDETNVEKLTQKWYQRSSAEERFKKRVIEQFRQSIEASDLRKALTRPEGNAELWREQSFEIVLGDKWVTGIFDRVAIERDASGKPLRATVIDFKSDEIKNETELAKAAKRYRPQLSLYGQALSRMLGIDPARLTLRLAFTGPGRVIDLD